jgi:hypothetical protein
MCTRKVESTGLPYFNRYFLSSLIFGLDFENVDGSGHANAKKSTFQFFLTQKNSIFHSHFWYIFSFQLMASIAEALGG